MRSSKAKSKAQAAMEFLNTYGWAILIIVVVTASLFRIGIFSPFTFAPRAQPGSCYVYRPYGQYNTQLIALEGECQGEIPQYVGQFSGLNSYIDTQTGAIGNTGATTVLLWAYALPPTEPYGPEILQSMDGCVTNGYLLSLQNGALKVVSGSGGTNPGDLSGPTITLNTWHQLGFVWTSNSVSSSTQGIVEDGNVVSQRAISIGTPSPRTSNALIGKLTQCWPANTFNGWMANFQVYNTSLSANQINALYLEGIGALRSRCRTSWHGGPSTGTSRTIRATATMVCLTG